MSVLATISESLKIWDYTDDSRRLIPKATFHSQGGTVEYAALAWNHTNQVIAVAGEKTINLVHGQQGQLLSSIPFPDSPVDTVNEDIACLSFSGNSRFIASGVGSNVLLWDLKRRNLKASLAGHKQRISALNFFSEGDIATGDESGIVRIWDTKTNTSSIDLSASADATRGSGVSCLNISTIGSSPKLAVGHNDGRLCVWDPVQLTLLRKQHVCTSTLTGLSFSPKNYRLVSIVGSDGRLALIDTSSKSTAEPSAAIDVGEHLTCVSFHEDAIHCVVGSQSGQILLFDWRNIRRPVLKIDAHTPYPVKAAVFQNPGGASKSTTTPVRSSASSRSIGDSSAQPTSVGGAERAPTGTAVSSSTGRPFTSTSLPTTSSAAPVISVSRVLHRDSNVPAPSSVNTSMSTLTDLGDEVAGSVTGAYPTSHRLSDVPQPLGTGGRRESADVAQPSNATSTIASLHSKEIESRTDRNSVTRVPSLLPQSSPRHVSSPGHRANDVDRADKSTASIGGSIVSTANANESIVSRASTVARAIDNNRSVASAPDEFDSLRKSLQPVTNKELQDALMLLKFDIHKEVQHIISEQNRLFGLAKDDTEELIAGMGVLLQQLLEANKALREENERLRRIY